MVEPPHLAAAFLPPFFPKALNPFVAGTLFDVGSDINHLFFFYSYNHIIEAKANQLLLLQNWYDNNKINTSVSSNA